MKIGMIGLGRMGANMVRRFMKEGHQCVAYDLNHDAVKALELEGAAGSKSIEEFISKLVKPRVVWLMVPAGVVDGSLQAMAGGTIRNRGKKANDITKRCCVPV